ncbi:MAG: hypothetical protein U0K56_08305 [Bacteroidaceae bacterium]|nr:hypothetical protein [Bacteroidaceae bacterium]
MRAKTTKTKRCTAIAAVLMTTASLAMGQSVDVMSDTWVCCDGLGRNVASSDMGVSRAKKDTACRVGMFYYVWHGQHGAEVKDITRLLEKNPDSPAWGAEGQFHWGSKPALGYYSGGDRFIVAKHMQMLTDAGIDFYFFDVTNAFTYDAQVQVVINEIDRRTSLGLPSPKLAFCCHANTAGVVTQLYNKWYKKAANDKYWFRWNGKPLILIDASAKADISQEIRDHFTMRHSWAWEEGEDKWPWLAFYPQKTNYSKETGRTVYEQMTVSTAMHPSSSIGKSYSNGREPAVDKYGLCSVTPYGKFFAEQLKQAISKHPKVLMLTQWNEWMAQRFIVKSEGEKGYTRPGAAKAIGETYFVDVYNQEFNRDIEPSSEPLIRDNYYMQMVSGVRRYRGVNKIPAPTVCHTINTELGFAQWADITPEFLDEPGDVAYTSTSAMKAVCMKRKSADIVACKVSRDADSLYLYARAAQYIPYASHSIATDYMSVLLNVDKNYTTGWEGYDYRISRSGVTPTLMRWDSETKSWQNVEAVTCVKEGKEMMYAVSRASLGMLEDVDFDFKWTDNTPLLTTEILDFIANGDCAPNGRFNYRYKGSLLPTAVSKVQGDAQKGHPGVVCVYSTDGSMVASLRGNLNSKLLRSLALRRGTYVAHAGGKSRKFLIK